MDPAVIGACRIGYFYINVYNNKYEYLTKDFADGGYAQEVTLRKMSYSDTPDSTTGQLTRSYSESTIYGYWLPRGVAPEAFAAGTFVRYDVVFLTLDGVDELDQIKYLGEYYTVESVKTVYDEEGSLMRECQLQHNPLYVKG